MEIEKIEFKATDQVKLYGLLHKPEEQTDTILISIHGMSSNCLRHRDDVIANSLAKERIAFFNFNNRGNNLMSYIEKEKGNGEIEYHIGGTSYEEVLESYHDIKGAILKMLELGYKKIYLQGHSLGATKLLYTYTKLKENNETEIRSSIQGIIFLSLIDIPETLKISLGKEKFEEMVQYAEKLVIEGKGHTLMPKEVFLHPISARTYLRYFKHNKEIDFARYSENDYTFPELNGITCPLFMRWGDTKELIISSAEELVTIITKKVTNKRKDISYIKDANHSYQGKEEVLAKQIKQFMQNNRID